jgi:hypothetical protein
MLVDTVYGNNHNKTFSDPMYNGDYTHHITKGFRLRGGHREFGQMNGIRDGKGFLIILLSQMKLLVMLLNL